MGNGGTSHPRRTHRHPLMVIVLDAMGVGCGLSRSPAGNLAGRSAPSEQFPWSRFRFPVFRGGLPAVRRSVQVMRRSVHCLLMLPFRPWAEGNRILHNLLTFATLYFFSSIFFHCYDHYYTRILSTNDEPLLLFNKFLLPIIFFALLLVHVIRWDHWRLFLVWDYMAGSRDWYALLRIQVS